MMTSMTTSTAASWVWLHIHWTFWGLAIFGLIAAIIWMAKYAPKKDFSKIIWTSLIVGILGGLLTIPASMNGWYDMMDHDDWSKNSWNGDFDGDDFEDMMDEMFEHMEEELGATVDDEG